MPKSNEANAVSRARVILSQVIACLALDFLLIGLGMSISFVTVVLPEVIDAEDGISLTKIQASWFGSMAYLCQPLGSVFSGPLLDYFGRKKALFLVNIPHLIAWLLMYYSWDVPSLFIANALLGIGTGIMEAPSVTYVAEISDHKVRGILTTLTNAFTSTGAFLAYLLGSVLPWRQAALISLTVPFITMGLVLLAPETPIWLLSRDRHKEALHSLRRLRGWVKPEDVQKEFDELVKYNEVVQQCVLCIKEGKTMTKTCEHSHNNIITKTILKLKHVFLEKETSRPFTLVMAYFFFHSICGLAPIRPNMINICRALGMEYDSRSIVIATGAVFIALNLLSAIIVKLIGKRKLVLISLLTAVLSSLSISIYAGVNVPKEVFSYDVHTFTDKKELLPVVLFMFLVCSHSLGIPWVLLSEVFPFKTRGTATSLAAALSYVVIFISSKAHFNLEANFHLSGAFAIYAICGLIGTIYLYFYLPETESKSLVEIEAYYKSDRRIFADDCFINAFRKEEKTTNDAVSSPMLDR